MYRLTAKRNMVLHTYGQPLTRRIPVKPHIACASTFEHMYYLATPCNSALRHICMANRARLGDVLLEQREQRLEQAVVLAEEPRLRNAARVQRRKRDARGVVEAAVHLAHGQHVAHLAVLVRLHAPYTVTFCNLHIAHLAVRVRLHALQTLSVTDLHGLPTHGEQAGDAGGAKDARPSQAPCVWLTDFPPRSRTISATGCLKLGWAQRNPCSPHQIGGRRITRWSHHGTQARLAWVGTRTLAPSKSRPSIMAVVPSPRPLARPLMSPRLALGGMLPASVLVLPAAGRLMK